MHIFQQMQKIVIFSKYCHSSILSILSPPSTLVLKITPSIPLSIHIFQCLISPCFALSHFLALAFSLFAVFSAESNMTFNVSKDFFFQVTVLISSNSICFIFAHLIVVQSFMYIGDETLGEFNLKMVISIDSVSC